MRLAVSLARQCPPSDTAFSVGAVIVGAEGAELSRGFSREGGDPVVHAEESALGKLSPGEPRLADATIYSTLEPCSQRKSRPAGGDRLAGTRLVRRRRPGLRAAVPRRALGDRAAGVRRGRRRAEPASPPPAGPSDATLATSLRVRQQHRLLIGRLGGVTAHGGNGVAVLPFGDKGQPWKRRPSPPCANEQAAGGRFAFPRSKA
jgi:hypothetical protein